MTADGVGSRDRDDRGRAHNARPRDELGRPLPYGSPGVDPVPEDLELTAEQTLTEAQRLFDLGRPFQAHEVLEAAWKSGPAQERELWQGLAQLAVGLTHALRGNRSGAATVLDRGRGNIAGFASCPHDIDVPGLTSWAEALRTRLADPQLIPTAPTLRRQ